MKILAGAIAVIAFAASALAADRIAPTDKVAFLGIIFLDTSAQGAIAGESPEETARIALLEDAVRERFVEEGFGFMDLGPIAEDLDRIANPAKCYGCDVRMGEKLGAEYIVVGEVQKVSNLILSMNLVMRSVETGQMVRGQVVDIRSNTDASWLRGIRYILKNNFFKT